MKKSLRLKALLTLLVGLFLSIGAFAQQIAVKGHVKDTTGEPVIGANVLVKGTTNGTITDFDGNFMLNVPKDAILSVSFVGYKSAEVKAASTVMVTLEDDSQVLDAVVVIGYGSVNHNRNRCLDCGYENAANHLDECPKCGSKHLDKLQRITGYLVGTTDRWNNAKLAELNDRIIHN